MAACLFPGGKQMGEVMLGISPDDPERMSGSGFRFVSALQDITSIPNANQKSPALLTDSMMAPSS